LKFSGLGNILMRQRIIIFFLILSAVAICIPGLFKLEVTVSMEDFFVDDDPVRENQRKFRELFNNNDFVGVLVETDDVFSRESLELIEDVGSRLKESVPLAKDLISITHSENPFMNKDSLEFSGSELKSSDAEIERYRKLYSDSSSLNGTLFSSDYKQAWILLSLEHYPPAEDWSYEKDPQFTIGKAAYDTVKSIDSGDVLLITTGVPVYAYRKEAEMMDDLMRVLIIGFITALVISILIIRSIQGVLGSVLVIGISVLAVFGIQGWRGTSIDSAFIAVPILLSMGVSIGYTVHISRSFTLKFRKTGDRKESVLYALRQSSKPILFTAFTTIVALASFIFIEIKPIQWVGVTSASCVLAVYILSITFFPVILSFGRRREIKINLPAKTDWLEPVLLRFSGWVGKYPKIIFIIFILASVIAGIGISRLEVDFNAEKMMGNRLPHMQDQILIGRSEIATSDTLDLVLTLPSNEFKNPEMLQNIALLENEIAKLPLVKKTTSVNSMIRGFNFLTHKNDPAFDILPTKPEVLRGLLNYYDRLSPDTLYSWIDKDFSNTRVFIELSDFSSRQIDLNLAAIENLVNQIFPPDIDFFMSGSTFQMAVMNQYVTRGLIESVITALIFISILMIIVFKSVRIGLAAMIPNIFPVAIAGGIMGFSGIPLEFVTMTVAPMIIGLAVDDTIHLVFHLKKDMLSFPDYHSSVNNTFKTVGSAITETTIILCMTFLVFTTSKVNSIINMGVLSCFGMLAAYLSDIFVTPVIIKWFLPRGFQKKNKFQAFTQSLPEDRID